MRIIDIFKNTTEEERRKAVTEILIKIENNKYQYEKPIESVRDNKKQKVLVS